DPLARVPSSVRGRGAGDCRARRLQGRRRARLVIVDARGASRPLLLHLRHVCRGNRALCRRLGSSVHRHRTRARRVLPSEPPRVRPVGGRGGARRVRRDRLDGLDAL
ncbi:MAG: hypothetical protein AVDCRST_MAG64-2674, partial [uncultured Phycisphaerae bacterium]